MKPLPLLSPPTNKNNAAVLKTSSAPPPKPSARSPRYPLDRVIRLVHQLAAHDPGQLDAVAVVLDHILRNPDTPPMPPEPSVWWFTRLTGRPIRLAKPRPLKARRKES
jgi:hypothetical protein